MTVFVISTSTLGPVEPMLRKALSKRNIHDRVITVLPPVPVGSNFNEESLAGYRGSVVLAVASHDVLAPIFRSPLSMPKENRQHVLDFAVGWVVELAGKCWKAGFTVYLTNGVAPPSGPAGLLAGCPQRGVAAAVAEYNRRVALACPWARVLDWAGLVLEQGYAHVYDPRMLCHARLRLSLYGMELWAGLVARGLAAARRSPRKCLVLDCDGTLWGGVLAEGTAVVGGGGVGHAYTLFQEALLECRRRGLFLALASKNDEVEVLGFIEKCPDMVLRRPHFSATEIHWESKAKSLVSIAAALGIGVNSLLFIDDNPHECERVRRDLPGVEVLQLPSDPAYFVEALERLEVLDTWTVTNEDLQRVNQPERPMPSGEDTFDFLMRLTLQVDIKPLTREDIPRVAQLCQRTNQMNVTKRRTNERELEQSLGNPGMGGVTMRARDKFGDYGLVGYAMASKFAGYLDEWRLNEYCISCRVLGLGLEPAMLSVLAGMLRKAGCKRLATTFTPDHRNKPAEDFLNKHWKFVPLASYYLELENDPKCEGDLWPIHVVSVDFKQKGS